MEKNYDTLPLIFVNGVDLLVITVVGKPATTIQLLLLVVGFVAQLKPSANYKPLKASAPLLQAQTSEKSPKSKNLISFDGFTVALLISKILPIFVSEEDEEEKEEEWRNCLMPIP